MTLGWEALVLVLLAAGIAGYGVGRRRGRAEGFAEGLGYAPLHLKGLAWRDGHCPVCGAAAEGDPGADSPVRFEKRY